MILCDLKSFLSVISTLFFVHRQSAHENNTNNFGSEYSYRKQTFLFIPVSYRFFHSNFSFLIEISDCFSK